MKQKIYLFHWRLIKNKENQYLFSSSSYTTLTELYNLNTDNYEVKSSSDFAGNEILYKH